MKQRLIRRLVRVTRRAVGLPRWQSVLRRVVAASAALAWLFAIGVAGAQSPAPPQEFGPVALEQIRQLDLEKASLAPHQRKIDSRLRRMLDATSATPKFPGLASIAHAMPEPDGVIALDIDTFTSGDVKAVVDAVQASGGRVVYPSVQYRTVRARVAPVAIDGLAQLSGVRFITPAREAITNKINTSEGDVTHRAAAARSFFGYDGTGVKVCVLSDGVSSLATAVRRPAISRPASTCCPARPVPATKARRCSRSSTISRRLAAGLRDGVHE